MMRRLRQLLLLFLVACLSVASSMPASAVPRDVFRALNDQQYYDNVCSSASGDGGSTTVQLAGNDNVEKLLNYLQSKGLTLEQASGIVGNAMWESGSKELDPKGSDGKAVGIFQWQDGRLANLQKHAGGKYQEFDAQVEYLGVELGWEQGKNGALTGAEAGVVNYLKGATSPEDAALIWEKYFERSADTPGSEGWKKRQEYAREIFEKYSKSGKSQSSGNGQSMAAKTEGGCSSAGASGKVNADGYAWPLALTQAEQDGNWPCTGSCHHDGTPAFDLAKKARDDSSEGVPVIAIFNGRIESFNTAYADVDGCHSFQLVGDDGWWYWYGHVQATSVMNGTTVAAGQQISEIGRRACTGNGSYPHLHIDRGSPKGSYGGTVCCRDPEFVPLMNKLYDELGGGGGGVNPRDL